MSITNQLEEEIGDAVNSWQKRPSAPIAERFIQSESIESSHMGSTIELYAVVKSPNESTGIKTLGEFDLHDLYFDSGTPFARFLNKITTVNEMLEALLGEHSEFRLNTEIVSVWKTIVELKSELGEISEQHNEAITLLLVAFTDLSLKPITNSVVQKLHQLTSSLSKQVRLEDAYVDDLREILEEVGADLGFPSHTSS